MPVSHTSLVRQSSGGELVLLTPDGNLDKLKEELLLCSIEGRDVIQVLGIRELRQYL
jgi:hypothetical protein